MHETYLHFYSAVSIEATARLTHDLSPVKAYILEQAKISYQAAASSLPRVDVGRKYHDQSDADTRSTYSTLSVEGSQIWNGCLAKVHISSKQKEPIAGSSSTSSMDSDESSQAITKLRPSPLRIRNISNFRDELTDSGDDEQNVSPCIRSQYPPPQHCASPPDSRPTSIAFCASVDSWLQTRSYERYNNRLASFAEVIANHISTVDVLIRKTREVQNARYFTKRLASYGEDEETRAANLRFRIARLKASGWKMERFAPERYQDLCARASAEL